MASHLLGMTEEEKKQTLEAQAWFEKNVPLVPPKPRTVFEKIEAIIDEHFEAWMAWIQSDELLTLEKCGAPERYYPWKTTTEVLVQYTSSEGDGYGDKEIEIQMGPKEGPWQSWVTLATLTAENDVNDLKRAVKKGLARRFKQSKK